jgi:hypothetical protein
MRTALQLFDFDDPSIADVKMLLLRAAFAPSFLRCAEGRRMVAHMFTLQPAFVVELTAIIKNQIPSGRKSGDPTGWTGGAVLCWQRRDGARGQGRGGCLALLGVRLCPARPVVGRQPSWGKVGREAGLLPCSWGRDGGGRVLPTSRR